MNKPVAHYDTIGTTYRSTRHADPRIVQHLIDALELPVGATIVDVGAGTGNYSCTLAERGYQVTAVEPSQVMRAQGNRHANLHWLEGTAEALPLADCCADAVISTLATHHFTDLAAGFREMSRVLKPGGRIVIFAADPRLCSDDCWFRDYLAPILERSYPVYKPIAEVTGLLADGLLLSADTVRVVPFLVPHDIEDGFFLSAWRRPALYLDAAFQANTSPLAKAPAEVLQPLVKRLSEDWLDGTWADKYGHVLQQEAYEGGYRFLIAEKPRLR